LNNEDELENRQMCQSWVLPEERIKTAQMSPTLPMYHPESPISEKYGFTDTLSPEERVRFVLDDLVRLKELVFQEMCRAASNEIDLDVNQSNEQPAVQLVTFTRLQRIYQSGVAISICLCPGNSTTRPAVLVIATKDVKRFPSSIMEISQIVPLSPYWKDVPSVVLELLSASDLAHFHSTYILLIYDAVRECWELIDFLLDSIQSETTTLQSLFENSSDVLIPTVDNKVTRNKDTIITTKQILFLF
jgi:hypothetical protein